jgi:cytochrome P450
VTETAAIDIASFGPEFVVNPYPTYSRLREAGPVQRVVLHGIAGWLVTGHDEVLRMLADPRVANDLRHAGPGVRDAMNLVFANEDGSIPSMVAMDPPDHTRLRRLVNKVFTPRRVEALRPRMEEITAELISTFRARGEADLIDEFAGQLPIMVIMELLGVPIADREDFRRWSRLAATEPEDPAGAVEANQNIVAYLSRMIAAKRARVAAGDPQDDLLTSLIMLRDDEQRLTEEELISMASLLLIAGFETTMNLIGNGMLALMTHPDQLAALRADPSLIDSAIEEFLRYDGPVQIGMFRFATEDIEIGDVTIGKGEMLMLTMTAADRDPARYRDPDTLDIRRDSGGHLAFGHGIHYCLGAPLARLEARVAIPALLDSCPDLSLAVDPADLRWRVSLNVRGVRHLPVRFTSRET